MATVVRDATCQGWVDQATRERLDGWALDTTTPGSPVALQLLDNGRLVARVLANRYREDLAAAGMGTGRHAFTFDLPGVLDPLIRHVIQVRRERDGAEVPGSPVVIEPTGSFDASLEQAVASAVEALDTSEARERALSFLVGQADRVLQRLADAEGRRAERLAHQRFRRRWGPQAEVAPEKVADPGKRALVVDNRLPVLNRDAGSHAIMSHMRALQRLGYAVSFVAAEEMAQGAPPTKALADSGIAICGTPYYASVEDVLRRQAGCFDVVYLHRAEIASRYLPLARRYAPRARILYSVADLHHLRLARQAEIEDRPELRAASQRMRLTESTAAWMADAVITHSTDEAELLRRSVPRAQVYVVPWDVPLRPSPPAFAKRQGVAFIGGYSHTPNVDAAHWLVEHVMPLVWKEAPDIECLLVGSEMPDAVCNLARPGIVAIGHVDDLDAGVFDRVRLTIAPLRYGAGLKGKVMESFAAGIPCVMSEVAAEGLALPPILQALVGGDAAALAGLVCRLHVDGAANAAAAAAGVDLIREHFTAEAVSSTIHAAIEGR